MSPLDNFLEQVHTMLEGRAKAKGYSDGDTTKYENELMTFTSNNFPGHALGEIVYKAVRYNNKHNSEDLVKIAAWAALQWMEDNAHNNGGDVKEDS